MAALVRSATVTIDTSTGRSQKVENRARPIFNLFHPQSISRNEPLLPPKIAGIRIYFRPNHLLLGPMICVIKVLRIIVLVVVL